MKEFIWTIIVLTIALTICLVQDAKGAEVSYNNMDSSFETIVKGDTLTKLETWEQPRTEYTPKNLRSQYQLRFSGKDGSNRVTSYTLPITDYDTYINAISKDEESGKMYVHDNAGRKILTGIDNTNQIKAVQNRIESINSRVQSQQQQINKLDNKIESGLATVTALTSLHPNPRSTQKLEVSVGGGMYADNVAGAVGIFYHPNDRVQLNVGASYGGDNSFAGGVGITFSLGRKKINER